MAGAVEKRKATLAAKKAAQAAADQRVGPIAPKPKAKPAKKEGVNQALAPDLPQGVPGMGMPFTGT
jgi:DNA uptake protein ComE-like DNA-binding protein